jgi:hypothetical protein
MHPTLRTAVLIAALVCGTTPALAAVPVDGSLALADRFVQPGWLVLAAAPDSATLPAEASIKESSSEKHESLVGQAVFFLGIEALLALPSAGAYADDEGKALAIADAGFAGLTLIHPNGGWWETFTPAVGLLALAGGMRAAGNNGTSKDQLFLMNLVGMNIALFGGRWLGSKLD